MKIHANKCEMCGAPLEGLKCKYCGTVYEIEKDPLTDIYEAMEKQNHPRAMLLFRNK